MIVSHVELDMSLRIFDAGNSLPSKFFDESTASEMPNPFSPQLKVRKVAKRRKLPSGLDKREPRAWILRNFNFAKLQNYTNISRVL